MNAAEIGQILLKQYGIRVEPEMSDYVLRRLEAAAGASGGAPFPVMGGHARTGVPLRQMIDPGKLSGESITSSVP